jgi:hypothetical protein
MTVEASVDVNADWSDDTEKLLDEKPQYLYCYITIAGSY